MTILRRPVQIVAGGISDSAADLGGMGPSEGLEFKNGFFDTPSTITTRRGSIDGDEMQDDNSSPAAVNSVPFFDFQPSVGKIFAIGHSLAEDKHYVYELDTDAQNLVVPGNPIAPILIPVNGSFSYETAQPVLFTGEGWYNNIFYAADVDGLIGMIRFDGDTGVVTFPNFTLGSGPAAPLRPKKLFIHKNHLILLGYGDENTPSAPDLLRSSTIGNPDVFVSDEFFDVGNTEEPLFNGLSVGDFALLFKERKIFRMAGSGFRSWAFTEIDPERGGVNHRCATYYDDFVWFLSAEGFARIGINGPSELIVDKAKLSFASFDNFQNCWVQANLPERMVVFACHEIGAADTFPTLLVQVDTRTGRWQTREYLAAGPITFVSMHAARIPQVSPTASGLGPTGPPTISPASTILGTGWDSNWVNGDLTAGTTTRHESRNLDTPTSFAQDASETVPVVTTTLTGKTPGAEYEERVRHERNGIFSIYDPPASGQLVRTDPPVAPSLTILGCTAGGITLRVTHGNQPSVGDIQIEQALETAPCPDASPTFSLVKTISNAAATEETVIGGILCDICYTFRARWVRTNFTNSAYSAGTTDCVACTGGP